MWRALKRGATSEIHSVFAAADSSVSTTSVMMLAIRSAQTPFFESRSEKAFITPSRSVELPGDAIFSCAMHVLALTGKRGGDLFSHPQHQGL
jgi:hypothetical protein